ncbi:MAG: rod shape-determining protein MreD [Gammaproteobacteria bacterium]|nr:rod shape-determining protein MreD [Gammaproteobacteria bacterium]
MIHRQSHIGIITLTFIAAFALSLIPLPHWAGSFRPAFVLMVLVYWCIALPNSVNISVGWIVGFITDIMVGTLLGQHALAFAIVAFLAVKLHQQIRVYPLWQQALSVFTLVALAQLLVVWVLGIIGQSPNSWLYWMPSFTSALIWPWTYMLMRDLQRKFGVT